MKCFSRSIAVDVHCYATDGLEAISVAMLKTIDRNNINETSIPLCFSVVVLTRVGEKEKEKQENILCREKE